MWEARGKSEHGGEEKYGRKFKDGKEGDRGRNKKKRKTERVLGREAVSERKTI